MLCNLNLRDWFASWFGHSSQGSISFNSDIREICERKMGQSLKKLSQSRREMGTGFYFLRLKAKPSRPIPKNANEDGDGTA